MTTGNRVPERYSLSVLYLHSSEHVYTDLWHAVGQKQMLQNRTKFAVYPIHYSHLRESLFAVMGANTCTKQW